MGVIHRSAFGADGSMRFAVTGLKTEGEKPLGYRGAQCGKWEPHYGVLLEEEFPPSRLQTVSEAINGLF